MEEVLPPCSPREKEPRGEPEELAAAAEPASRAAGAGPGGAGRTGSQRDDHARAAPRPLRVALDAVFRVSRKKMSLIESRFADTDFVVFDEEAFFIHGIQRFPTAT